MFGVARDVTKQKMAEEELRRAKQRAEAASIAKSQFLASMSHEIRTPLNSVIGFTDLLRHTPLDPTQRTYVEHANQSGHALLELVTEIMDFSKIEAGMMQLDIVQTDMRALLENCIGVVKFTADSKSLNLMLDVDSRMPRFASVDPVRLRQILTNLLGNAVKFTDKGEVKLTVEYDPLDGRTGRITFTVRDTGIGISDDYKKNIFEAFSQEDSSMTRKYGGTGLGLAISARLAQKMGSKIAFNSTVGEGSEFYFDLLVETEHTDSRVTTVGHDRVTGGFKTKPSVAHSISRHIKILIAEDNPVNALLLKTMLAAQVPGADFLEAENGRQAVDLYKANTVDLIFMDIQMPDMDGYAATREIRALEVSTSRHVPIIALTAGAFIEDEQKSLLAGMDDFITKPVSAEQLEAVLFSKLKMGDSAF